jgi:hypothetical protein
VEVKHDVSRARNGGSKRSTSLYLESNDFERVIRITIQCEISSSHGGEYEAQDGMYWRVLN